MGVKVVNLIFLLGAFVVASEGSNILCMFVSHSPSHLIVHMSYARALLERGHNVTLVTSIPIKDKHTRLHHILIPPSEARVREMDEMKSELAKPESLTKAMKTTFSSISTFVSMQSETIFDKRFQDFMHNPNNKFDLMILGYFITDYLVGVGAHFKCPIVISWMGSSNLLVNHFVGNPPETSYVAGSPFLGLTDPLTFKGRLVNYLIAFTSKIMGFVVGRQVEGFYNQLFPAPDYPSFEEAKKKVSLLFCNSHFSEGVVRPNVPALIDVGGIQIKDKPDPLPERLQKIFNASSEHGVIYVSFGSNLGNNNINPSLLETIYRTLANLKQTVLWKWDEVQKPGSAPNIHYEKWLPQDDLLAQPNLRLFITHAGKGSITESQYHGVPIVAVPFFGDQFSNAAQMAKEGFGLMVDQATMSTETLSATVLDVLENPKYKESVQRFSTLYRDRPMTARETAVYWIEYVIRHKGAYHMQSPLVHLNTLQYNSVDVIAFLLLVGYVLYKLITIPVKFVWRKICKKSCSKKQKVKKH